MMNVLTFETCWTVNSEIIKQMTSIWSIFIQVIIKYYACNLVARKMYLSNNPPEFQTVYDIISKCSLPRRWQKLKPEIYLILDILKLN